MTLTVGSLFAGIGCFDLALERIGMKCRWQVEIDKQCQQVLKHHWPNVPKFTDIRQEWNLETVDLICGGWPCQDLSIAGKRAGLRGKRSGLFSEMAQLIQKLKPRWFLLENVTGLFSQNKGKDTALVLKTLTELGYCVAWRVLDAQWSGVAQRRRRVFFVGSLGNERAAEVLFERGSGAWRSTPSHEEGPNSTRATAACLGSNPTGGRDSYQCNLALVRETGRGYWNADGLAGLRSHSGGEAQTLAVGALKTKQGGPDDSDAQAVDAGHLVAATLLAHHGRSATDDVLVAIGAWNWQSGRDVRHSFGKPSLCASQVPAIGVRRLMPIEWERLMGLPDQWTDVDGMSDSARYRMIGNAVAVPVVEWIGKRIVAIEQENRRTS